MVSQGQYLHSLLKAKGFNIQQVADELKVTRVIVERDLKKSMLTRNAYRKYEKITGLSYDKCFADAQQVEGQTEIINRLQAEIIHWQRKYIDLQERFFPNAGQYASIR